ncbi:DNA-directed RNA polymerase III subunit RPC3 isoform X2 [Mobula hypostoma]|uniref:DNA-directed RNA polymerase III subunit RPC3 isoform X2 n=1 Tax=Mobula hypostoma TaxID=723540 RepID=UPI002FC38977
MTHLESQICSHLLQAHYGQIVANVGTHLVRNGCQPLRLIASDTDTPVDQVKKALCVLIHHNFAAYRLHKRGYVEYELLGANVQRILRYPRYIYSAKTLYGDTGELIVEELLQNGKMSMSTVVKKVADRLTETMEDNRSVEYSEASNTFVRLVETHFLQKCETVPELPPGDGSRPPPVPTLVSDEKEMYTVPNLGLIGQGKRRRQPSGDGGEPRSKRSKHDRWDQESPPDDGIYWQVNFDRFHQHFRDQAIIAAVSSKLDQTSSEIVRTMLRLSEVTTSSNSSHTQPLSSNEIFRAFPSGYNISKQVLDQYLTLLSDDPMKFVGKTGESGGGMFVISSRFSGLCNSGISRAGTVRLAVGPDIPAPASKAASGAEAGGGFCHDPSKGSEGDDVPDVIREFHLLAGNPQDTGSRSFQNLLPVHCQLPGDGAHDTAALLQDGG